MLLLFTDSGASAGGDATLAAAGPATVASASSDLSAGCVDSALCWLEEDDGGFSATLIGGHLQLPKSFGHQRAGG